MKKILAIALACVMALSMAFSMSAGTAAQEVNALYFNEKPTIDGVVTEEEWGEVTVRADKNNPAFYITDDSVADNYFDLWLRWDEDYLYLAVQTPETDGHSLPASGGSLWNGDVIQFRPDFNPDFSKTEAAHWSDGTPNCSIGLVSGEGNTLASYDFQGGTEIAGINFKVNVDTAAKMTTYEAAIPYAAMNGKAGAGTVFGFAIVRLNASTGTYESWLTWGDGICGPQDDDLRVGSNKVTMVDDPAIVIEEEDEEEAAADGEAAAAEAPKAAKTIDAAAIALIAMAITGSGVVISKKH